MTLTATAIKPVKKSDLLAAVPYREKIEAAIVAIAGECDGAHSRDKIGFNGTDTRFGKSLAYQIVSEGKKLTYKQAYMAVKMLQKYSKQFEVLQVAIPSLEDLQAAYPADYAGIENPLKVAAAKKTKTSRSVAENKPTKHGIKPGQVTICNGKISIYFPHKAEELYLMIGFPHAEYYALDEVFTLSLDEAGDLNDYINSDKFLNMPIRSEAFLKAAAESDTIMCGF